MKKFIRDYAAFNVWANNKLCDVVNTLSDEQFNMEMKSSFPTIKETIQHIMDTQDIWMERFEGRSPTSWPSGNFQYKKELTEALRNSSKKLEEKARQYSKKKLKDEIAYTTLKGISGNSAAIEMFAHVMNHGTYHRGQLITMLRMAGITELPATDLIAYFREKREKEK